MKILFCLFIQFTALWLDLFLSNNGYQSTFCSIVFIYLIITYNWFWSLPFSLISFVIYDNLTGLCVTYCFFLFSFIGLWWKDHGDCSRLWLMLIPYFLAIVIQYGVIYFFLDIDKVELIKAMIVSLLITLPIGIIFSHTFNMLARYFGLPQSTLNKERYKMFFYD